MRGHVQSGWRFQGWAIDCRIMARKQVRSRKDGGHMCGMGFQIIAGVERPLVEASSSAAAGNRVTFSAQTGEIENINTGRKMPLVLRCGICIWRRWSGVRTLGFSRTVHVMDAFTSVFCALRMVSRNPPMSAKRLRMRKKQRPAHPSHCETPVNQPLLNVHHMKQRHLPFRSCAPSVSPSARQRAAPQDSTRREHRSGNLVGLVLCPRQRHDLALKSPFSRAIQAVVVKSEMAPIKTPPMSLNEP